MRKYSFLDGILLVNGVEIGGFDEGDDSIVFARLNDSILNKVGTDGEMSVAVSADRRGSATFRLMQTSSDNAYLGGLVTSAENGVFVPVFVQWKDTYGGDLISGTQGYITKPADATRGENVNGQEWVIVLERLDFLYGTDSGV